MSKNPEVSGVPFVQNDEGLYISKGLESRLLFNISGIEKSLRNHVTFIALDVMILIV